MMYVSHSISSASFASAEKNKNTCFGLYSNSLKFVAVSSAVLNRNGNGLHLFRAFIPKYCTCASHSACTALSWPWRETGV